MREQYPFFRDGDEQTQAVIGEEAVNADLDGDYQKPYAVLTQRRLYCKNEQGNFITDASALQSASKGLLPGQNWFLGAVTACVGLTLVLLCLWYWGLGGRGRTANISYNAQQYIDDYRALEEKIPEYEQTIKDYEEAEKEIEKLQQELADIDYTSIKQEAEQVHREADRLQAAVDEATGVRTTQEEIVRNEERYIADCKNAITEAENKIKNTDTAKNNEIKSQIESLQNEISIYRSWKSEDSDLGVFYNRRLVRQNRFIPDEYETYWLFDGQKFSSTSLLRAYCGRKIEELQKEKSALQEQYIDIESLQATIEWNQTYIAESEGYLAECQQQLEEAQEVEKAARTEVNNYRPMVTAAEAKVNEVESLKANIAQKQSALDSAALSNAQSNIQRFKDSKADYKNAQSVQRKVNLFLPCLFLFAVCVATYIVLAVLKKAKLAVAMSLAATCMGLVCASLSDINLKNIQDFGWDYYYIMPPPLSIALRILPILAVILGVLALWWNRKKTVYQIVHNTGAFYFTPSVYPAEELRLFTEQVQLMREGGADGE